MPMKQIPSIALSTLKPSGAWNHTSVGSFEKALSAYLHENQQSDWVNQHPRILVLQLRIRKMSGFTFTEILMYGDKHTMRGDHAL